jgi:PKD domain
MRRTMRAMWMLLAVGLSLATSVESGHALSSFGRQTDQACQAFNGTTPFADNSCALCHTSNNPSTSDLNQNGQFFNGNNLTAICPVSNVAPISNAGPNQSVTTATTVTLNGSDSSDADGNPLTYLWSFVSLPAGSGATLTGPTTVRPTFLADRTGQYIVQLIVNDGVVSSTPARVTITTTPGNTAPVANAGPDQTVQVGALVTLNGSGSSDVDGNPLTYQWMFLSVPPGSTAQLRNPTTAMPTFMASIAGQYEVKLLVNDGTVTSLQDTVTITTTGGNTAPVANAGPDQSVQVSATVTLNGSGSNDADRNPLSYDWSFASMPPGSTATLSNPTAVGPSFVVDKAGLYVAQLIVNDGTMNSTPDTATVTVAIGNTAPVANAGPDQTVAVSASVVLDGNASTDADRTALTYQWSLTGKPAGSTATLANFTTAMPRFTADVAGRYIGQLIVNDGTVSSAPDTVIVTAGVDNTSPVANAGPDQIVTTGTTVVLDGTASRDADGHAISWKWTLTAKPTGSAAALSDPISARPSFLVDTAGEYVAQLVVNDGQVDSPPATVMIKTQVMPPARGIYISRASWNAETGKLKMKGRAPNGATVEILDADTGTPIATSETGRHGRFRLYVTVQTAPCALIAKANGLTSIRTPVAGAPASCGNVKLPRNDDEDDEKGDKRKSGSKENHARDGKSLLKQNRQDR